MSINKKTIIFFCLLLSTFSIGARAAKALKQVSFGKGQLTIKTLAPNAVRVNYSEATDSEKLPDWVYTVQEEVSPKNISVRVNADKGTLDVLNGDGKVVLTITEHQLRASSVAGTSTYEAQMSFIASDSEGDYQYGLGQFQDGFNNIRGLSRRLTQVNTQISIPMLISNKGYGILWNNYGLTEFNPADKSVALTKMQGGGKSEVVDVTSTEGGKHEVRQQNKFAATLNIDEDGKYALLLDVGQKMARRHNLVIDGQTVIEMKNLWLPPTASQIVYLKAGAHQLTAELTSEDKPVLYYKKVEDITTFRSPVAQSVDYTVFIGSADEIIAAYRHITGDAPLMPEWALGYIHCRERFHSQKEILDVASRFRREQLPADVMVQDWQYWGRHGWNAMRFDERNYPDPKALTDSLHNMNMRLMLSVWSKIDKNSEVGKSMLKNNYYIPGTDWIDFFNPEAASAYWKNFSEKLLPLGIDAWWQDATEPENDDLLGRRVCNGRYPGELFRNVYPLMVNKTVCEGLLNDQPEKRPMILTRCGFAGIQRYGSALWSGDVGNDWETLRRQISAGLGMQAAGIPWWTYDAGGFFRHQRQYTDASAIECMLRWIETSVYLPLMRVHGYMSNTEPWEYGKEAYDIVASCLNERYRLLPYIYSNAAAVTMEGSTLMRPLVFDFPTDDEALKQKNEYMFGKALLVSPVTEGRVSKWQTYLPKNKAGWYDFRTEKSFEGGKTVTTDVDKTAIPVFVRGGSIMPYGPVVQHALQASDEPLEIRVYPGSNASFTLYEDDGESNAYKQGEYSKIKLHWNDASRCLQIDKRVGCYEKMPVKRQFSIRVVGQGVKKIEYSGKKMKIKF